MWSSSTTLNCGLIIPNVTTCPSVSKLFSSLKSGLAIKNSSVDILLLKDTSGIVSPGFTTYSLSFIIFKLIVPLSISLFSVYS